MWIIPLLILGYIGYLLFGPRSTTKDGTKIEVEPVVFPRSFGWLIALVILGYNFFAYDVNYGIGTGLFNACLIVAYVLSFPKERRGWWVYGLASMSILAGFGIGWRANGFVQSIDSFIMSAASVVLILLRALPEVQWQGLWLVKYAFALVPASFTQMWKVIGQSQRSDATQKTSFISIAKTVFLTLLVVAFFIAILSKADPIFAQLIGRIRDEAVGRTVGS
jgi:hypothetical protein